MRFLRRGLIRKLLAYSLLLSIVPLAIVGYLVYQNGRQALQKQVTDHLTSVAILKEQEINGWIDEEKDEVRLFASLNTIRENLAVLLSQDKTGQYYETAYNGLINFLKNLQEKDQDFLELFVLNADEGRVLVSTDSKQEGKYKEDRPYFVAGRKSVYVQNVYYSLTLGAPAMTIAAPINDESGQAAGVLVGRIDLGKINGVMAERTGLGETGETYLVNRYRFFVTESRFEPGYPFRHGIHTLGVQKALRGNDGVALYEDYRGVPIIGAYRWMEDRELALLAEMDQAEAFAPIRRMRNVMITIAIVVTLSALFIGIISMRTITGSIFKLVSAAEAVGKGELEQRIEVGSKDEIGQLADAFNKMVFDLRRSRTELAEKVKELSALYAIAAAVSKSLDLEEILDATLDKVLKAMGVEAVEIFLIEEESRDLVLARHRGIFPDSFREITRLKPGEGFPGRVAQSGQPLVTTDLAGDLRFLRQDVIEAGFGSFACIPLKRKEKVVGTLDVAATGRRPFNADDIALLTGIGHQISVAIENTRLYGQIEERAQELNRNLIEQKQYAEKVLRSIADGVYSVDRQRVVVSWNKGAETITGYTAEPAIGRACADFLRHTDEAGQTLCDTDRCPFLRVWASGQPMEPEQVTAHSIDGRRLPVAVTAAPIFDQQGQAVGAVEVFRDVSKERELMKRIQAASQAKSDFLASMSHELRTPLNAIIGFSQALEEQYFGELNEKQEEYVKDILDSGKHLLSLVNDILDLSKIEAGKLELELSRVNIKKLLADSLIMIKEKALKGGISLELDIPEEMEDFEITADRRKLKQVMFNLLSNAAKFTPDGGSITVAVRIGDWPPEKQASRFTGQGLAIGDLKKEKEIIPNQSTPINRDLRLAPTINNQQSTIEGQSPINSQQSTIEISVADTGIGIAPGEQEKIFDEFYQSRGGIVDKTPGTGLGLPISKRMVEMHGGRMWVNSDGEGKGSRFSFVLPLKIGFIETGELKTQIDESNDRVSNDKTF